VNADQIAGGLSAYAPETVSLEASRIMLRRFHRRFQFSLRHLFGLYLPLSDRWSVLDNAGGRIETIATGTPRRTSVKDPEKWLLLQSIAR
jgi:predicted ABC-type ATPase